MAVSFVRGHHSQRILDMGRYVDATSALTIIVTLLLFGTALFARGLAHDLLLEQTTASAGPPRAP